MSLFSLTVLLENETAREWLLCRTENSIQPSTIETAYALKAEVEVEGHSLSLELLVKPIGVVNRILIGYVLGDPYQFALPKFWGPMVHPACRRFIFDLEKGEFLEFHWYVHNNTVLVNWMKFPTVDHRIRYFILFEAPEVDKLPHKLLHSVEIVTERTIDEDCLYSEEDFQFPAHIEEELSSVPTFLHTLQSMLGVFGGTCRWSRYDPDSLDCLSDSLYSYSVVVRNIKFAENLRKRELQRFCHYFADTSFARPSCKSSRLAFHEIDSSRYPMEDRNLVQCNNFCGASNTECVVCQSRQEGRRVWGWTNSWNFIPGEYLAAQEVLSTKSKEGNTEGEQDSTSAIYCSTFGHSSLADSYSSCSGIPSNLTSCEDIPVGNFADNMYGLESFHFLETYFECSAEDAYSSESQEADKDILLSYTLNDDIQTSYFENEISEYLEDQSESLFQDV
ncbi:hypothetical protein Gasu2_20720 [Galdieria sulphuraria]|uniref:Uncharacterized protein n=1 Tax=Galdieria sulphuraria TaxID=130081 RepID=M2W6B4_GALSU|nr:hypothetical protein Gasu_15350 isoform 1 [Galdieria sulphuraria]XP_005707817.1 hypothetical protein Gasu_15350 isoform 2 [Galdieria sulphuraria]EME31296.1 hypothetical protein isoform 1 [Galdieria sulphuraria]EME31297.1 hypothetical protein isoform 2 [Galdieria sulphuraria]GJD07729.1 hypothetical protein Gasu2_20720 [Galdieria sulphuraria]|eukprot:XP_005707816.1 hypothetical protein isoform 1 [Galdieria sulphuraria]